MSHVVEMMEHGDLGMKALDDRLADVEERLASAARSLTAATAAYKKCKQRKGVDAHKRSWYFEEKMKAYRSAVDALKGEAAALRDQRSGPLE